MLANAHNHPADNALPPFAVILEPEHLPTAVQGICRRISNMLGKEMDRPPLEGRRNIRPAEIAVLVRSNCEVDAWAERLEAAGLPVRSDAGVSYLRQPEIIATYRFLQLLTRYPDDVALAEVLSTPHFHPVDLRSEESRILNYGVQRGKPLTDAYEQRYPQHAEPVRELLRTSRTATVPQLLGLIERAFGLKEHFRGLELEGAAINQHRLWNYARKRFDSD